MFCNKDQLSLTNLRDALNRFVRCTRSMHHGKWQNLKTVMWPLMGWYVILLVTLDVVYMYKTFNDSSFSYSWDMKWSQPLAAAPGYIISDRRISFHSIADSERERIPKKVQLWPEWRGHTEKMWNHYREPERIGSSSSSSLLQPCGHAKPCGHATELLNY